MKPPVEVAHEFLVRTGLGETDECQGGDHGIDCLSFGALVDEVRSETLLSVSKPEGRA